MNEDSLILIALRGMERALEQIREGHTGEIMTLRLYYRSLPAPVARRLNEIDRKALLDDDTGHSAFDTSPQLLTQLRQDAAMQQIQRAIQHYEEDGGETHG